MQIGIASVLPTMILSGTLWPRESMPSILQFLSNVLPVTATCDLSRAVLLRTSILPHLMTGGLAVPMLWSFVFAVMTYFSVRMWLS